MEKMKYTEYSETIKPGDEEIDVTLQVPEDASTDPDWPVHLIIKAGGRVLKFTLKEFEGINDVVHRALKAEGWIEEP